MSEESDIRSIEAGIQWMSTAPRIGYSKMRFDHFWNVRCD